jgi:ATP-dependent 26S proteasome regulatory subunit
VKAMEIDEKPTEDYSDIGGLDKQIQVCESVRHDMCVLDGGSG